MQFVINGLRYIGTVISYTRTPPLPLLNRMDRWQAVNATFIRLANIDTGTVIVRHLFGMQKTPGICTAHSTARMYSSTYYPQP